MLPRGTEASRMRSEDLESKKAKTKKDIDRGCKNRWLGE
jgi:hypothetical protein